MNVEVTPASGVFAAMVNKLYESFLDDPTVYRACERYWAELSSQIANSMGQKSQWTPWIPRNWVNGTPMELDGNPIFDWRNEQLGRAFRIVQNRRPGDELDIAAWIKAGKGYSELPEYELVISLGLSEESAHIAQDLLRKWMAPETTPTDIESFITKEIEPHYRRNQN